MSAHDHPEGDPAAPGMTANSADQNQVRGSSFPPSSRDPTDAQQVATTRLYPPPAHWVTQALPPLLPMPASASRQLFMPAPQQLQQSTLAHDTYIGPGDVTEDDTESDDMDWNVLSHHASSNGPSSVPSYASQSSMPQDSTSSQAANAPQGSYPYMPFLAQHVYSLNGNLSHGLTASFDTSVIDTTRPPYSHISTQGIGPSYLSSNLTGDTSSSMATTVPDLADEAVHEAPGERADEQTSESSSVSIDSATAPADDLKETPPGRYKALLTPDVLEERVKESRSWSDREMSALDTVAAWALIKLKNLSFDDRWKAVSKRLATHYNVHRSGVAAYHKYARIHGQEIKQDGKRKRSLDSMSSTTAPSDAIPTSGTPMVAPAKKIQKRSHTASPQSSTPQSSIKKPVKKARGKTRVSSGTPSVRRLAPKPSSPQKYSSPSTPAVAVASIANAVDSQPTPEVQLLAVGQKVVDTFTKHTGTPLPANWEIVLENVVAKFVPYATASQPRASKKNVVDLTADDRDSSSDSDIDEEEKRRAQAEYEAWCSRVEATGNIGAGQSFLYQGVDYVEGVGYPEDATT
ncbi:hypothetical protein SLS57_011673 [Botryosphaeria dothidea]